VVRGIKEFEKAVMLGLDLAFLVLLTSLEERQLGFLGLSDEKTQI